MRTNEPALFILASRRRGTLYTGATSSLSKLACERRKEAASGCAERRGLECLVYYELHGTMGAALARAQEIRGWNRAWTLRLVDLHNPAWRDLWEEVGS